MNKEITNFDLVCRILKGEIKEGTHINCYMKGYEEYPIKYLYTNGTLWKTEPNIPDNEMEVRVSQLLNKANKFEILDEENDEFEEAPIFKISDYKETFSQFQLDVVRQINILKNNQKKIIESLGKLN